MSLLLVFCPSKTLYIFLRHCPFVQFSSCVVYSFSGVTNDHFLKVHLQWERLHEKKFFFHNAEQSYIAKNRKYFCSHLVFWEPQQLVWKFFLAIEEIFTCEKKISLLPWTINNFCGDIKIYRPWTSEPIDAETSPLFIFPHKRLKILAWKVFIPGAISH